MNDNIDYNLVLSELKEMVGDDYVSSHPAILNCHTRDFTTMPSGRPNIVVMPGSTKDVQELQKISHKHGVPVVVMSTGFNHGGLALSQRGGLMVDLRRMNKMEIDEESLTATIGPAVQARTLYRECKKVKTAGDLELKPSLALSFASVSVLSNYVSAGGGGWAGKYGANSTLIVDMTWVLPNGEILKTGPGGIPNVGKLGVPTSPGPNIAGMFINASGTFGICTEMTIKIFVDKEKHEKWFLAILFNDDDDRACEIMIDLYYAIANSNIHDATYKTHSGLLAQSSAFLTNDDPLDLVSMMPTQPLVIILQGLDEEELEIKSKLIEDMCVERGMSVADPYDLGFGALVEPENFKGSFGIHGNNQCAYKGCFQFCGFTCKMEDIPQIWKEWKEISKRYWALKHERVEEEVFMSGFNTQGPLPFGRVGVFEVDWWWNHGDPEEIKRATQIVQKFNEFGLKKKGVLFRNNMGGGFIALPHWGVYFDLLKGTKDIMDPQNIMNPDVLPIGNDYLEI